MPRRGRIEQPAEPRTPAAESATGVKSAQRAITLLEVFAANRSWLSLAEMHTATGFPRSSLHGLLRTLRDAGWIDADETGTRFRLGIRALICGTAYVDRDPVIPFATEALESLREKTGFTTHYARLAGTEVVYLETRESRTSAHLVSRVGRALPAHATALGKALLAELADPELTDLLPPRLGALTAHTLTDRDILCTELEVVRTRGYATEREEGTEGVACVAAPVPYRIPATDAISCSMPLDRVTEGEQHRIGAVLAEAATELARTLRRAGIR